MDIGRPKSEITVPVCAAVATELWAFKVPSSWLGTAFILRADEIALERVFIPWLTTD